MPEKQRTLTLRINGHKTKVGIEPINVAVVGSTCDEKAVSGEQKGSCDGSEEENLARHLGTNAVQ